MSDTGIMALIGTITTLAGTQIGYWIGRWHGTRNCVTKEQLEQIRTAIWRQCILLQGVMAAVRKDKEP
jgi:membrane protein DedA with SNARE-associated domain